MSDITALAQYVGGLSRKIDYLMTIEKGTATGGGGGGTAVFNDAEGDPANVALTAADGGSNYAARRDHRHAIPGTVVQTLGTVYFAGTAEVTPGTILGKLLTVDGSGSSLDADTLDGSHGTAFATAGHTHSQYAGTAEVTPGTVLGKLLTVDGAGSGLDADLLDGLHATAFSGTAHTHTQYAGTAEVTAGTILSKLLTVDGSGSGLDADFLDGVHLSAIMGSVALAGMDINALTLGTVQANDTIPFYDSSLGSVVKSDYLDFFSQFFSNAPATNTEGQSVRYIQWNNITGSAQYITRNQLLHTTGLSSLGTATIDPSNDLLFFTDVSAGTIPRVTTVGNFLSYGGGGGGLDFDDIDSLSPIASLALDDTLAVFDESASAAGKATLQEVWDSLGVLSPASLGDVSYDRIPYWNSTTGVTNWASPLLILGLIAYLDDLPHSIDPDTDTFPIDIEDFGTARASVRDVFTSIKTIDGTGSGLDADLLDGSHASAFAAASHSHDASAITTGTIDDARIPSGIARDSEVAAAYAPISHTHSTSAITDYEDGTWTPTLTFGGNAVGITYGTRVGTYVKIGKLVYITCTITLTSKGSSTGSAFVEGLPFNCNTTTNAQHRLTNFMDVPNGDISMASIGASQADRIALVRVTVATQAAAVMTNTQFSNTSRVWVTGVYSTD